MILELRLPLRSDYESDNDINGNDLPTYSKTDLGHVIVWFSTQPYARNLIEPQEPCEHYSMPDTTAKSG